MLTKSDLIVLHAWCRSRAMRWTPGRTRNGAAGLLLEPARGGLDAMLLVIGAKEMRLLDAAGQELAAASDLPALLDAVDGGVADQGGAGSLPGHWPDRAATASRGAAAAA